MEFYKILMDIMNDKNLSIPDVARLTRLSDSTIRSIIARKTKNVSLEVAFKMSKGLNVSLERLNGESVEEPSTLSTNETKLLECYNQLNALGKNEATKRVAELTEIPKYISNNEISATIEKTATQILRDMSNTLAAHDDDLTNAEKAEMDKRVLVKIMKHKNK